MTTESKPITTALININPNEDQSVVALSNEAQGILRYAEGRAITDDSTVKLATEDLSMIAKLKKAIEDKRKEYVVPINDHLKAINESFKILTAPLESADRITRGKILTYRQEQERKAKEAEEINRLRMEAARKEMELKGELTEPVNLVEQPASPPAHVRTEVGTLGTAKVWKFEVTDFTLLPDDYKLPDLVKIRKVVIAGVAIPGVKAWQEETLKINTR